MSNTVGDLKLAVFRFVRNNSNALDVLQGQTSGSVMDDLMDGAVITAMNNARLYAEKNANFSALETTALALLAPGMGLNLNRCYSTDAAFEVSAAQSFALNSHQVQYRWDGEGVLHIAVDQALASVWYSATKENLKQIYLTSSVTDVPTGLYTVWDVLFDRAANGLSYSVFKMAFRKADVVLPTAWADLATSAGPAYFCDTFRMNQLLRVSGGVTNSRGQCPISFDTAQSYHKRQEAAVGLGHGGWVDSTQCLLLQGRTLTPNWVGTAPVLVELTGLRWMEAYTLDNPSATDFLLTDGFDFMMWQTILELNYIVQIYVPRVDGSLPPPEKARNEAWGGLLVNDAFATVGDLS